MWRLPFWRAKVSGCNQAADRLSAYIDGRLGPQEGREMEKHLQQCQRCAEELESLQATVQLLHRVPQAAVPRSFAIARSEARPAPRWSPYPVLRTAMTLAAACLLVVFAFDMVNVVERSADLGKGQEALSSTEEPSGGENERLDSSYATGAEDSVNGSGEENTAPDSEEDDSGVQGWVRPLEFGLLGLVVVLGGVTVAVRLRGAGLRRAR